MCEVGTRRVDHDVLTGKVLERVPDAGKVPLDRRYLSNKTSLSRLLGRDAHIPSSFRMPIYLCQYVRQPCRLMRFLDAKRCA
jgi:hypothetical protein